MSQWNDPLPNHIRWFIGGMYLGVVIGIWVSIWGIRIVL